MGEKQYGRCYEWYEHRVRDYGGSSLHFFCPHRLDTNRMSAVIHLGNRFEMSLVMIGFMSASEKLATIARPFER